MPGPLDVEAPTITINPIIVMRLMVPPQSLTRSSAPAMSIGILGANREEREAFVKKERLPLLRQPLLIQNILSETDLKTL